MLQPTTLLIMLVILNVIWAGSYTVMKFGIKTMDAMVLVYLRILLSAVILGMWVLYKRFSFKISKKDLVRVCVAGLMTGTSQYLVVKGISCSYATDASMLYVFEPIGGIMLAGLILKERLNRSTWIALLFVLMGFARLSNYDPSAFGLSGAGIGFGNLLIVIGLVCESLFSIVLKPISHKYPATLLMMIGYFTAAVVLSIPMWGNFYNLISVSVSDILILFYLVVICSVIGYSVWVKSMGRLPVSLMYFSLFVQPIAGPFIASITIGERIDQRVIVGGVFLVVGMLIAVLGYLGIFGIFRKSRRILFAKSL